MISPFFRRSSPRPGAVQKPVLSKPAVKPKPGILGEKGSRTFSEMKIFMKKAPYKSYSKASSRKFGEKERMGLVDKWKNEMKAMRIYHKPSTRDYDALIKKKRKELGRVAPSKKRDLQVEIDTMETIKKGF